MKRRSVLVIRAGSKSVSELPDGRLHPVSSAISGAFVLLLRAPPQPSNRQVLPMLHEIQTPESVIRRGSELHSGAAFR